MGRYPTSHSANGLRPIQIITGILGTLLVLLFIIGGTGILLDKVNSKKEIKKEAIRQTKRQADRRKARYEEVGRQGMIKLIYVPNCDRKSLLAIGDIYKRKTSSVGFWIYFF